MPGENLAGGESDLSIALAALEEKISGLEKSGQWWPGMVAWTAAAVAPAGFLIADGSAFDTARYAALAVICPTGFLPDMRGRFPYGASDTIPVLSTGGAATHTLTAAESGFPTHMHTIAATTGSTTPGVTGGPSVASTGAGTAHSHGVGGGGTFITTYNGAAQDHIFQNTAGATWATNGGTATLSESAHTHSMQSHTHTSAAHTHPLPDTDNATGVAASSAHSILNPYVALTPLIHI